MKMLIKKEKRKKPRKERRALRVEEIKTLDDILADIDKKMVFKIFDTDKPLKAEEKLFEIAHKIGRILQYIKVLTKEIKKLKGES